MEEERNSACPRLYSFEKTLLLKKLNQQLAQPLQKYGLCSVRSLYSLTVNENSSREFLRQTEKLVLNQEPERERERNPAQGLFSIVCQIQMAAVEFS